QTPILPGFPTSTLYRAVPRQVTFPNRPATPGSDRTRTEGIMPATVTCPACERQLRVPLEVIGGQVRCPLCHAVFLTRRLPHREAEAIRLAEVVEVEPPPPQAITHTPPV